LEFGLMLHPHGSPAVYLAGAISQQELLTRDTYGPRAILNALDRLAGSYRSQLERAKEELGIAAAQLRDYQARLGAAFTHDEYLQNMASLRDQLKAVLAGATADANGQPLPPSSELAERIKSLKAAHTIDSAPKRIGSQRPGLSGESVTRRIHRRALSSPAADRKPTGPDVAASSAPARQPEPAAVVTAAVNAIENASIAALPTAVGLADRRQEHTVTRFLADRPVNKRQPSLF
jgi:hypothetical protein